MVKRFYLAITLEDVVTLELDTAADITLMPTSLFTQLQNLATRRNRILQPQEC